MKPNIILAMADDQGWGDMGYNGHPLLKTPNFDAMAAECLRFDRFYAAAPVCSPTRGSVLTGRHPNRFGCFTWGYTLRPQEITVAEMLKEAGYATGHFGKWHLGSVRKGSAVSPGGSGFDEWFSSPNFYENAPLLSQQGTVIKTHGEGSAVTVEKAIGFIREKVLAEKPFLAVIWFGSPHAPHEGLDTDVALYADAPKNQQHFLAEVTAMDRAMGTLRTELRDLDIADNTVLWYTSDNGAIPQGSTGGLRGKKGTVYEGGLRVPALIDWPSKVKEPRTVMLNCGTVDIYPTVLDLAGVAQPGSQPPLDGQSLAGLIAGDDIPDTRIAPLGFWDYPAKGHPTKSDLLLENMMTEQRGGTVAEKLDYEQTGLLSESYAMEGYPGHAAWLDGDWKLHRLNKPASKDGKKAEAETSGVTWELYNLAEDPEEETDLFEKESGRAEEMKAALEAWLQSVVASLGGEDYE